MYTFDEINKFPVMIAGNYRSGTTYLCQAISIKYNLKSFPEPTIPMLRFNDIKPVEELKKFVSSKNEKFVLKILADQMDNILEYKQIWENSYKIIVYRENKIDQILSYYIARVSNVWNTTLWLDRQNSPEEAYKNFSDKIIRSQADYVYNQIYKVNELLLDLKKDADIIVSYEDIDFEYTKGDETAFDKLPRLENLETIKKNLLDYYDSKGRLDYLNSNVQI
jgi:hypothetical protein